MQQTLRDFSYLDTACSFVYFNLVSDDYLELDNEVKAASELRDTDRQKFIERLTTIAKELLSTEFRGKYFHEWHHSLQTIFYPYRYLQSWRELSVAFRVLSDLRHSSQVFRLGEIDIPLAFRDSICESSMVYRFNINNDGLVLGEADPSDPRPNDITLTDLIEDATCIFQYKIEKGEEGSGKAYREWTHSTTGAYTSVFGLLTKLLGIEGAYTALPPLIQASFYTTWPMPTFSQLVNFTVKYQNLFKPEVLGCDEYYALLISYLEKWVPPTGNSPDPNKPAESDELYFLNHDAYSNIINNTPNHVAYPLARKFLEFATINPLLKTILFHPYHDDVIALLDKEFLPSLTVIRLDHKLLKARDTLIIVNPSLLDMPLPLMPDINYSEYLRDVMKRKDVAYSLFTDLNNYLEHNCHHQDCPYYPTNACRRWSAIPKEWSACPFPKWFAIVTDRSINFLTGELNKISKT